MFDGHLRDPVWAAIFAAAATMAYVYFKAHINNEKIYKTSTYAKPASLVALLVYFIVSQGVGSREPLLSEPF